MHNTVCDQSRAHLYRHFVLMHKTVCDQSRAQLYSHYVLMHKTVCDQCRAQSYSHFVLMHGTLSDQSRAQLYNHYIWGVLYLYYPPPKAEGYRFGVVRLDVWMSICMSQTCLGYISKTITDLNMKLQWCIDLI